jgi:peptidoglycan/xylan/chitin deacetylase (PgdA/CDA1 family)
MLEEFRYERFTFVTPNDFLRPGTAFGKNISLTFDDGRLDNYDTVLPILWQRKVPAVFYVCPGLVGRSVYFSRTARVCSTVPRPGWLKFELMNWSQLREICSAGFQIGCHADSHAHLPDCDDGKLAKEIVSSKERLEQKLQCAVTSFAYPWGGFDRRVFRLLRDAGYCTAVAGSINAPYPPRPWGKYTLPRITLAPGVSLGVLKETRLTRHLIRRSASQVRRVFGI